MIPENELTSHNNGDDRKHLEAILNEISARLVLPSADTALASKLSLASEGGYIQIMAFHLGELSFGIEISSIDEVVRNIRLTRVPGAPVWLKGVTSFHGEIVSVVDLGLFLGIENKRPSREQVVLIAHAGEQRIGLIVESVDTIYTTPADQIASPSFPIDAAIVPYLRGAIEHGGEFIRLLHGERLLLGQQMQQFS